MAGLLSVLASIPVDPSSPQAQDWITGELAKPEYQAAKPTWFDLASKAVQDWLDSLFSAKGGDAGPVLLLVVLLVVAGLVVAAFFVFGRPRVNRRSAAERRVLFGDGDARTAAQLHDAASIAARSGDWATAIEEQFRAIAAGLAERTLVSVSPGTTATDFSVRASAVAPAERDALAAAARTFDEVRYLDRSGSEAGYQAMVALEQRLQQVRPSLTAVVS